MEEAKKQSGVFKSLAVLLIVLLGKNFIASLIGIALTYLLVTVLVLNLLYKLRFLYPHVWKRIKIQRRKLKESRIIPVSLAVIVIFFVGFASGFTSKNGTATGTKNSGQDIQNEQMIEVLDKYQDVSKLFYLQQQDMDVIIDPSIWENDPQQLTDAITAYKKEKDEIIFQWGRLYELRVKANLPPDTSLKVE